MDETYLRNKEIKVTIGQLTCLKQLGFTMSEVLFLVVVLNLLDNANCLIIKANYLSEFLEISQRHVYRTLQKVKNFGVVRNGNRYDFTTLKERLDFFK